MAEVTSTTVQIQIGQYVFRAEVVGNAVELYRDGVHLGSSTWDGGSIADWPKAMTREAHDPLVQAIADNLRKGWRAKPEDEGGVGRKEKGPRFDDPLAPQMKPGAPGSTENTSDAANHGQMGNDPTKPSRQGEKEVGVGGPGGDPNTGDLGGQAIKQGRRAIADGFTPTPAERPPLKRAKS